MIWTTPIALLILACLTPVASAAPVSSSGLISRGSPAPPNSLRNPGAPRPESGHRTSRLPAPLASLRNPGAPRSEPSRMKPASVESSPQPANPPSHNAPATGSIVIEGKTYLLGTQLGKGTVGVVYRIGEDKVAKKFRIHMEYKAGRELQAAQYKEESENTRIVLGDTMSSGESRIGKDGEIYGWIISPRLRGEVFKLSEAFKRIKGQGVDACVTFMKTVARPEFERKLTELHARTKLVHLDPHQKNTFWDKDLKHIVGFIDFDRMGEVDGPRYRQMSEHLTKVPKSKLTLKDMVSRFADKYYGDRLCHEKS